MQPHSKALGVKASTYRFGGGTQPLTGGFAPSHMKCPLWTDFIPHYIGGSYHVQLTGRVPLAWHQCLVKPVTVRVINWFHSKHGISNSNCYRKEPVWATFLDR